MNTTLVWLLGLPIILGLIVFIVHRKYPEALMICGIYIAAALIIVAGMFFIAKGAKTSDQEIWNGQITSKSRVH